MTRGQLVLSIAALCCLLPAGVNSQESAQSSIQKSGGSLELVEAEVDLLVHELQLKLCELEVDEAKVELKKRTLELEAAQEDGNTHEVAHAKLEIVQGEIRIEMRKAQSDMMRFKIRLAKARLEHIRAMLKGKAKDGAITRDYSESAEFEFRVFSLVNADAMRMVKIVSEVFPAIERKAIRVSADNRTNSVIASGLKQDLAVLQDLLLRLDEPNPSENGK